MKNPARLLFPALLALSIPLWAQANTPEEESYQQELTGAFTAVRERVGQRWDVPPSAQPTRQATLSVEVAPSGAFEAATVTTSSGDRQFDRSAIKAVSKALPLPQWGELSMRTRERLAQFNLSLGPRGEGQSQSHEESTR